MLIIIIHFIPKFYFFNITLTWPLSTLKLIHLKVEDTQAICIAWGTALLIFKVVAM